LEKLVRLVRGSEEHELTNSAMVLIHRFMASNSVSTLAEECRKEDRLILASSTLYLASKMLNVSYLVSKAVTALIQLGQEEDPKQSWRSVSVERQRHYADLI
jgi:hypothetical protein